MMMMMMMMKKKKKKITPHITRFVTLRCEIILYLCLKLGGLLLCGPSCILSYYVVAVVYISDDV